MNWIELECEYEIGYELELKLEIYLMSMNSFDMHERLNKMIIQLNNSK